MSFVHPKLRPRFETLSPELRNAILERNVKIYTLQDLIRVLEEIVSENS
jgi:hypothetical protein